MNTRKKYDLTEQVDQLKAKDPEDLRDWIETLLKTSRTESPNIISREEHPSTVLLGLYDVCKDTSFQQRIRKAVTKLVFSYNDLDPLEYFYELIVLIANLRIVDCYRELVSRALSQEFKGKKVHMVDLHYQLLRVLFTFKNYDEKKYGKDLEAIIKRDIKDDIYFSVSFRANWERKSLEDGLRTIFELLDVFDLIPESYVNFTLRNFFRKINIYLFWNVFKKNWPNLSTRNQSKLIFLLSKSGICITKPTPFEFPEYPLKLENVLKITWQVDERYAPKKYFSFYPDLSLDDRDPHIIEALQQSVFEIMKRWCDTSKHERILGDEGLVEVLR